MPLEQELPHIESQLLYFIFSMHQSNDSIFHGFINEIIQVFLAKLINDNFNQFFFSH